ncbi:MAG TPA: hemolysin III family protein [Gaiellaceae bacterium]|nr:hemolysin III family protein [Gaiellaceae bacterium]
MDRQVRAGLAVPELRPSLRGLSHAGAFVVSVPLGLALVLDADTGLGVAAAIVFATSVATMFGASALYHCLNWPEAKRRWLRRIDHVGVYGLIAGTYTPIGLLVLRGDWKPVVLGIVWGGALVAVLLKFVWLDAPKWLAAAIGVALGWVGAVVFPQLIDRIGLTGSLLVFAGGLAYTAGALVYAFRRPNPYPAVFGYHEIFHVLVIAAVALQYSAVAFYVLPD